MRAYRFPHDRRVLGRSVVMAAAVSLVAALASTSAAAHHTRLADKGIVTGAIHRVGGPYSKEEQHSPEAGEVSVFTASGRLAARQHVRDGQRFGFNLAPGHYLLNGGKHLHNSPSSRYDCNPVKARVHPDRTVHLTVGYGCGWK